MIFQLERIRAHGLERCVDFESLGETGCHAWTRTRKGSLSDCNLDRKLSQTERDEKLGMLTPFCLCSPAHVNKLFMFTIFFQLGGGKGLPREEGVTLSIDNMDNVIRRRRY